MRQINDMLLTLSKPLRTAKNVPKRVMAFYPSKNATEMKYATKMILLAVKKKSFYYILSHHPKKLFLCQFFLCIGKPDLDIPLAILTI